MLTVICKKTESCMRLMTIPGIGFLSATALVATAGDAKDFKNGREFSAWLGLVPRQKSSGGKTKLLGISKRGDGYLRKLLVHGSRAIIYHRRAKDDPRSLWIKGVISRSGKFKAMIAQANKTARIAWAVLAKQEQYREAA